MMRYLIVALSVLFTHAYELKIEKTFTTKLEPTVLVWHVTLKGTHQNSSILQKRLHKVTHFVHRNKSCQGGAYSIYPHYDTNHTRTHFQGQVDITCQPKSLQDLEALNNHVDSFKELDIVRHPMMYRLTQEQTNQAQETLQEEAIVYSTHYSNTLKTRHIARCTLHSINTQPSHYTPAVMMRTASMAPTKEPIDVRLRAQYIFTCQ